MKLYNAPSPLLNRLHVFTSKLRFNVAGAIVTRLWRVVDILERTIVRIDEWGGRT